MFILPVCSTIIFFIMVAGANPKEVYTVRNRPQVQNCRNTKIHRCDGAVSTDSSSNVTEMHSFRSWTEFRWNEGVRTKRSFIHLPLLYNIYNSEYIPIYSTYIYYIIYVVGQGNCDIHSVLWIQHIYALIHTTLIRSTHCYSYIQVGTVYENVIIN